VRRLFDRLAGPKFRLGAVPSLPATFNDPVEGLTVSAAVGPCGVAALTKTQVIAADVKSDPLWESCAIGMSPMKGVKKERAPASVLLVCGAD